jgi:TolA-binding protein
VRPPGRGHIFAPPGALGPSGGDEAHRKSWSIPMTKTHATSAAWGPDRVALALCVAGLLCGTPALAADMPPADTAAANPAEPVTAMADPAAAMPTAPMAGPEATAPAGHPAPQAAPKLSPAVTAALNAYYHGDYSGAEQRLHAAAAADPADPAAPYFLGYTYYRMGEFAKSRTAFAQAYKMDPHFSPEPPTHQ